MSKFNGSEAMTSREPGTDHFDQSVMARALIAAVLFYRNGISPMFSPKCRYIPSCSAYALEALQKYGAIKGGRMALRRVLRCHPFSKSGYDPVP